MSDKTRPLKFDRVETHTCDICCFKTDKISNYKRHLKTEIHRKNTDTVSYRDATEVQDNDSTVPSTESEDDMDLENEMPQMEANSPSSPLVDNEEFFNFESGQPHEQSEADQHTEWFPFQSKLHFLLSVLSSSKMHKVSDEVMMFFLFILQESGVKEIPSLANIKTFWSGTLHINEMLQMEEDKVGNLSCMVKPTSLLKLCLANPKIASKIARYPTSANDEGPQPQSQGSKWKSMDFHWGISRNGNKFLLGDFVEFRYEEESVFGKIIQFIDDKQNDILLVKLDVFLEARHIPESIGIPDDCFVRMKKTMSVDINKIKVVNISSDTKFSEKISGEQNAYRVMSRSDRDKVLQRTSMWKGNPIVTIPVNIFIDDLSANLSRRWAPLHAVQMQLSGLPLSQRNKQKHTMFLTASDKVEMLNLLSPVCDDIQQCKTSGIEAYDAYSQNIVTMTTDISLLISDYNMTSLACNHLGPSANKFCPKCFADNSDPCSKWELRKATNTQRTLERLKITNSKTLSKETGVKLYDNCLWQHVDPHRDTPIGILHFLYLGLAKHLIQFCLNSLNDNQKATLGIHLESIDQSYFSYKINSTFFKYLDSRQGKDFKHYLQIAPFNMEYAGLKREYLEVICKLALISKHMLQGYQNIEEEVEQYLELIKNKVPQLATKRKTHLSVHLSDDIERHGHPTNYSEDNFEKNHGVIRKGLFQQNGHAKSRDTAVQFLKSELMQHIIDGGYLQYDEIWKSASGKVLHYGNNKKILSFMGMAEPPEQQKTGQLKRVVRQPNKKPMDHPNVWTEMECLQGIISCGGNISILNDPGLKIFKYMSCVTRNQEEAFPESFVLYKHHDKIKIGQIKKMIQLQGKKAVYNIAEIQEAKEVQRPRNVQPFQYIQLQDHVDFLPSNEIQSLVHVIHDCQGGRCRLEEGQVSTRMEQKNTLIKKMFLKHDKSYHVYVINMFRLTHCYDKVPL